MDLITPSIGLIFWQAILFIFLFFFLAKFVWNPILSILEKREKHLKDSLQMSQKIQKEMNSLKLEKKNWIKQSHVERDLLLKETRILSQNIIQQAKENAQNERCKLLFQAKKLIEDQKKVIFTDIKNQVAGLSINIAEKLLKKELKNDEEQKKLIESLLDDLKEIS